MKSLLNYIQEKLIVNKDYKTTYDDSEVLRIFKDEIATSDAKQKYFKDNYSNTWKSNVPSALWITVRNDFVSHPYSYQLNNNDAETLFKYLVEFDAIYEFRFNPRVYSSAGDELIDLYAAASDVKKPDETDVKNVNIKAFKFDDIAIIKATDKTNGECRMFVAINIKSLHEKLVINKDYTNPNVNEDFYIKFKKAFEYLSNNHCWRQYESVEDIRGLQIAPKYQINIALDFRDVVKNKIGKQIYKTTFAGFDEDAKLYMWKEMIKYIWDNEDKMKFIMSEDLGYGAYFIREFETQDWLICLIGPEKVTNMSENGHLLFSWK